MIPGAKISEKKTKKKRYKQKTSTRYSLIADMIEVVKLGAGYNVPSVLVFNFVSANFNLVRVELISAVFFILGVPNTVPNKKLCIPRTPFPEW